MKAIMLFLENAPSEKMIQRVNTHFSVGCHFGHHFRQQESNLSKNRVAQEKIIYRSEEICNSQYWLVCSFELT